MTYFLFILAVVVSASCASVLSLLIVSRLLSKLLQSARIHVVYETPAELKLLVEALGRIANASESINREAERGNDQEKSCGTREAATEQLAGIAATLAEISFKLSLPASTKFDAEPQGSTPESRRMQLLTKNDAGDYVHHSWRPEGHPDIRHALQHNPNMAVKSPSGDIEHSSVR